MGNLSGCPPPLSRSTAPKIAPQPHRQSTVSTNMRLRRISIVTVYSSTRKKPVAGSSQISDVHGKATGQDSPCLINVTLSARLRHRTAHHQRYTGDLAAAEWPPPICRYLTHNSRSQAQHTAGGVAACSTCAPLHQHRHWRPMTTAHTANKPKVTLSEAYRHSCQTARQDLRHRCLPLQTSPEGHDTPPSPSNGTPRQFEIDEF